MRPTARLLLVIAGGAVLAALVGGCSGAGTPAVPREIASVQTVATDHVTSLLLVKPWFSILWYKSPSSSTPGKCKATYKSTPLKPGDPKGSRRYHGVMSDCTQIDVLLRPDGSGTQDFRAPDGRTKSMVWGPVKRDDDWTRYHMKMTTWDGATLEYDRAMSHGISNEQYNDGTARLSDGRAMRFRWDRSADQDRLKLNLNDGSQLVVEIPVTAVLNAPYWPIFSRGGEGSYRTTGGGGQTFKVWGTDKKEAWEHWSLSTPDGTQGQFTLGREFAGAGNLTRSATVLAAVQWPSTGLAQVVEPVGASAAEAVPSAAARDFQIDQWIGKAAAMGPMPLY